MRTTALTTVLAATLLAATCASAAEPSVPSADTVLERMLAAAGGREAFAALGVVELAAELNETTADGSVTDKSRFRGYAATDRLDELRLELDGDLVIVRSGASGWATRRGEMDTRPQTPIMARGTATQRLFPLLMPFSLTMEGLAISEVHQATFDGVPTWSARVAVPPGFFTSPMMNVPWTLHVAQSDGRLLAAEFQPPPEFAAEAAEGVRYRYQKTQSVGGVKLPSSVMMEGMDASGVANAHVRVVTIAASSKGEFDPVLFLSPDKLQALDEGDAVR